MKNVQQGAKKLGWLLVWSVIGYLLLRLLLFQLLLQ